MKKRILITGGAGYIGSLLAFNLIKKGYEITIYDSLFYDNGYVLNLLDNVLTNNLSVYQGLLTNKYEGKLPKNFKNFKFINGDIRDKKLLEKIFSEGNFDFVFHFAELVGFYRCEKDKELTRDINFEGTKNLIDLAIKYNNSLIYNSTSSVYGSREDAKEILYENSQIVRDDLDTYCIYKLLIEDYILEKEKDNKDFKFIILRPATVGGLSLRMRLALLPNHFTYAAIVNKKLSLTKPNNYRAVIDIDDLIGSYLAIMKSPNWKNGIYNIGNNNMSKKEYANEILKIDSNFKLGLVDNIGKERNLKISQEKFSKTFGFTPSKSFKETILPLVKMLKEKPEIFSENNFKGVLNEDPDEWNLLLS